MKRISIMSDIHVEHHADTGTAFIESIPTNVDIIVLAGDICTYPLIDRTLKKFCDRFKNVVYVLGNHEHYGCSHTNLFQKIDYIRYERDNLTFLNNSKSTVDGIDFVGGTLWFPEDPVAPKQGMPDFKNIPKFESWVYEENAECSHNINYFADENSVVVTHHAPSHKSIHDMFKNNILNPFFLSNEEETIYTKQPKLWIHGHMHTSFDYMIDKTRVICNPLGYPNQINIKFDEFVVEV